MQAEVASLTRGVLGFIIGAGLPTWQALSWWNRLPILSPLRTLGRLITMARAAGSLLPFVLKEAWWIWLRNWPEALHEKQKEW